MTRERVAKDTAIKEGELTQVTVGETEVLLTRARGQIYATTAHCPHHHAPMSEGIASGERLLCPWHQSVFNLISGEPEEPPALDGLVTFNVAIDGDDVIVDVPDACAESQPPYLCRRDPAVDSRTFVIVGAGAAGVSAAQELRRVSFAGRIIMLSHEERSPYDRTHCSKDYLAGEAPAEWLPLRPDSFYGDYQVERITARVAEVDVGTRRVTLESGEVIEGDALLLATGASPRTLDLPGANLDGVLTLRSWRDADRIINAAEGAQRVALIGGSFIGMEVASSLKQRGVEEIHVIAPERVTFESVLGEQVGRVLMRLHEENGIVFHLGHTPEEVRGGTRASSVLLDDGTAVAADLVIIGVGVKPATDMIRGATLEADGSLRVESDLRVAEGVYAAGDIATFPHPLTGAPTRVEHWRLAQQHGEVAARNMAGQAASFDRVPFFWTMQHGMPLNYVGHAAKWDEIIIDGDLGQREFIAYYVSQGRVLAASGMGRDKQLDALHELFLRGAVPAPSELRGEGVDLVARLAAG